jgi:alkylation response protein AidB-like acyl-CoA dehydrogenase
MTETLARVRRDTRDTAIIPPSLLAGIERRAAAVDEGREDLSADVEALRQAGILTAPLPDGGGIGVLPSGALACVALLRAIGRANLSLARLVEGHVNAVKLAVLYGAPATRKRVEAGVRAGRLMGVWGADAGAPVTLSRRGGAFVLEGTKRFASGLGVVADAVVTAATDGCTQLVLVPADDPSRADPAAWRMSGMRATRSGTYRLDGLLVDEWQLLGEPGDYGREPHFEGGVWRYCAAHLGGAEALYGHMVGQLTAAGRADDPLQARRIAEAAVACETARLWVTTAALRAEAGGGDAEGAAAYALLAREATEAACLTVIDTVERALGTAAHDTANPVERLRRDLSLFLRQAAPDAKRARAAARLVSYGVLPEAL